MPERRQLITLAEHNHRIEHPFDHLEDYARVRNGIACPQCGAELWDVEAGEFSRGTDDPPIWRKKVRCTICKFSGDRLA